MRSRWLKSKMLRQVYVHTTDDQTVFGVLEADAPDGLVLRAAILLGESSRVPMAGEVFIPRGKVSFIQVQPLPEVVPA